jgi:hypothetical protein
VPVNSTHPDYEASALDCSPARAVLAAVKRFAQIIFSASFGPQVPAFAVIRKGFVGQALPQKRRASLSPMSEPSTACPP